MLCFLAFGADRAIRAAGETLAYAAVAIATYAFVVAVASLALGPHLLGPLLLLVASYALALRAPTSEVARIIAQLGVLMLGAFAGAYGFAIAWGLRFGQFPMGGLDMYWSFVALASAGALAAGLALAARRSNAAEIVRGTVAGYAAFGAAGLTAILLSLPIMYPHGEYVNLGIGAFWTTLTLLFVANTAVGSLVLWLAGRVPWWFAIFLGTALTIGLFAGGVASAGYPLADARVSPPLLILPSSSTSP